MTFLIGRRGKAAEQGWTSNLKFKENTAVYRIPPHIPWTQDVDGTLLDRGVGVQPVRRLSLRVPQQALGTFPCTTQTISYRRKLPNLCCSKLIFDCYQCALICLSVRLAGVFITRDSAAVTIATPLRTKCQSYLTQHSKCRTSVTRITRVPLPSFLFSDEFNDSIILINS